MKKVHYTLLCAVILVACSQKEDFLVEPVDGLIDVTFAAGTSDSDTKVWAGWADNLNRLFWNKSDAIGLFAGDGNVNRMFNLSSEADAPVGTFSGKMMPVSTPVTLYAYYPYSEGTTLNNIPYPDLSEQVFEGTFEEHGSFTNLSEYALLVGERSNFTIDTKWPAGKSVNFSPLIGLVRFGISSTLSIPLTVKSIGMVSNYYSFIQITSYNLETGGLSGYYSPEIKTSISERNPLVVDNSATRYVQMASAISYFDNETIYVLVDCINDGQNFRFLIPKNVSPDNDLYVGKRASVSVPITEETAVEYASRVKVTTAAGVKSLVAPTFEHGYGYTAADAVWGDSDIEKYQAGKSHGFKTQGEHTSSFNHWGESGSLTIEKLTGITAIDFSDVY